MDSRTKETWNNLALEAAARMAEHDSMPADIRTVSNEDGLAAAREVYSRRSVADMLGLFHGR